MKRKIVWLKLEWKRAAGRLPVMLLEAAMLAILAGVVAFCGSRIFSGGAGMEEATVAVVPHGGQESTGLAVEFVRGMESVKDWCRFVMTDEETGKGMLERGEAVAVLVLPERVVEGILDGTNVPAVLYLSETMTGAALVFRELAAAGVSMLGTAQAEIYAAGELYGQYGTGGSLADIYSGINRYNLYLALGREGLFRSRQLSATSGMKPALYYAGAAAALYVPLLGMALGEYPRRRFRQAAVWKRAGISTLWQTFGRWGCMCGFLCAGSLLPGALLLAMGERLGWGLRWSWGGAAAVLCCFFCAAAFLQFVCLWVRDSKSALFAVSAGVTGMGFLCGCFVPETLLPSGIRALGEWLPLTWLRRAFCGAFQGRAQGMWQTAGILCLFTLLFLAGGLFLSASDRE